MSLHNVGTRYGHIIVHQPPKIPQTANLTLVFSTKLCVGEPPAFNLALRKISVSCVALKVQRYSLLMFQCHVQILRIVSYISFFFQRCEFESVCLVFHTLAALLLMSVTCSHVLIWLLMNQVIKQKAEYFPNTVAFLSQSLNKPL